MMARRRAKGLTKKLKKVLTALEDFQQENGYPPSIREICKRTKITSTSVVNYYLEHLEELGYIERDSHVSRGIRLLKTVSGAAVESSAQASSASFNKSLQSVKQSVEEMLQIPVLGRIVAGEPIPIPSSDFPLYDTESMVDVARSLLPPREKGGDELFALEVQGDSMIDAMVNDGDIIIMKPAIKAQNGEMVSVWLNNREETTLKYFYLEGKRVRLQPANPNMQPTYIEDPSTVEIQGKVVMVIRQVEGK